MTIVPVAPSATITAALDDGRAADNTPNIARPSIVLVSMPCSVTRKASTRSRSSAPSYSQNQTPQQASLLRPLESALTWKAPPDGQLPERHGASARRH